MKYPKINYIGNKNKVADWIVEHLPLQEGKILDLFCGGCSISYKLKEVGYTVYSNDVLFSNYVIAKSLIENINILLTLEFNEETVYSYYSDEVYQNIKWMINTLYFKDEVKELASLINFSHTLIEDEKFMFLTLLRRSMIRKLPYSRMNIKWEEIVKLRDEEYSYLKYKRKRAYHNQSFTHHILAHLSEYNLAVFDNSNDNKAFHSDAMEFIKNIGFSVDMIYIDPPYPSTMNKYIDFYGSFDKMLNMELDNKTDFTYKGTFLENIVQLIILAKNKTKYIIMSLNNKCNPSSQEIKDVLTPLVSNIQLLEKEHVYKITGKENKNTNYEILMIITV